MDKASIRKKFEYIHNEVLDEYNKGALSEKEMSNIMEWCSIMKKILEEESEDL